MLKSGRIKTVFADAAAQLINFNINPVLKK